MKQIAVRLLAVAARRQLRRTPLPSRESFTRTPGRHTSSIRAVRQKISSGPSKAVSAITSAARLSRFWRRREGRRSSDCVRECEDVAPSESLEEGTATTVATLREGISEDDLFIFANPPNSPATSSIELDQLSSFETAKPSTTDMTLPRSDVSALLGRTVGLARADTLHLRSPSARPAIGTLLQRARSLPTTKVSVPEPFATFFSSLSSLANICVPSASHNKTLVSSATMLSLSGAGDYLLEPRLSPSPTGMFAKLALPIVGIFSGSASPAASIASVLPSPWSLMDVPEAIPLLEVKHLVQDAVNLLPVECLRS